MTKEQLKAVCFLRDTGEQITLTEREIENAKPPHWFEGSKREWAYMQRMRQVAPPQQNTHNNWRKQVNEMRQLIK